MTESGSRDKVLVILGPTAVGKTDLSLDVAERLQTEIISGDSMLVYRGFDIGTAKPTPEERRGIPHHLIDLLEPVEPYDVTRFQQQAGAIIHDLNERGKLPIIAGGTGLYLKALLEGYEFNEQGRDSVFRERLRRIAKERGSGYLYALLQERDSKAAAQIHPNNLVRVIRALEVAEEGRESISRARAAGGGLIYDAFVVGLTRPREVLYERISRRVDAMVEAGLIREVEGLLAAGVPREAPAMKGIGYKEIAAYLAGEATLEEAIDTLKKNTRHFAKRQLTWFRRMDYIHWIDVEGRPEAEILEALFLELAGFFEEKVK